MANNNGTANLAWFLTGIALGAAATLILAPQTGEETREYLRGKASVGGERLRSAGQEALERGRELYDRGKELADDAVSALETGQKTAKKVRNTDKAGEVTSS